jgi:hypothetical protein
MSYSEARSHFENAKNNTLDKTMIDLLDGLKHLTHSVEEDIRTLSLSIRDIHDIQIRKTREGSFSEPIPLKTKPDSTTVEKATATESQS